VVTNCAIPALGAGMAGNAHYAAAVVRLTLRLRLVCSQQIALIGFF
jgi:hypothetical protein